ncbi:MAG: hypothetical protein R3208_21945, partial [Ketobacteraceae bacterium]|nr:hypothetical protein [Ketobacteraceae bacterium]
MKHSLNKGPLLIAGMYFLVAMSWIYITDLMVSQSVAEQSESTFWHTIKGALFVLVTAILLLVFIRRLLSRQNDTLELVKASEASYRELFFFSPAPMIIFDLENLQVLDANNAVQGLCQKSREVLRELRLSEVFPDQEIRLTGLMDKLNEENDKKIHDLIFNDMASGDFSPVDVSCRRVSYNGGRAGLMVLDHPEERFAYLKNIEQAAQRLDIARQISGLGCWEIDLEKEQISCCNNVVDILGVSIKPNQPISFPAFQKELRTDLFNKIVNALENSNRRRCFRSEQEIVDSKGVKKHIMVDAQIYKDHVSHCIVGTFIDLSEQKRTQEKLREREVQFRT